MSFADFITKAKTLQQKYPEYHILIQTDQAQFWHAATAELKNVYRFSETPFTTSNTVMHEIIDEADKGEYSMLAEVYDMLKNPYEEQPAFENWFANRPEWARHKVGCSMLSCSS